MDGNFREERQGEVDKEIRELKKRCNKRFCFSFCFCRERKRCRGGGNPKVE